MRPIFTFGKPAGRRPAGLATGLLLLQALSAPAAAQLLATATPAAQRGDVTPAAAAAPVLLKTLLQRWEAEFKATIFYESALVENKRVPEPRPAPASLAECLATVLPAANLQFKELRPNYFVVTSRLAGAAGASGATGLVAAPQNIPVSGRVTGAGGQALPGVTVLVKGTSLGIATNADGSFALNVPEGSTLVFSYVGYVRQEVAVGTTTTFAIELQEDLQGLGEVVVVGYGTQSRRELTTAVSSVSAQALERQPVAGFDQALQGQAAGVQVTAPSGAPGAGINVRIRGNASASLNGSPLYVIDGVPVLPDYQQELAVGGQRPNPLNALNPNDIESIDILKDGAAAAIYGLRASNGVVVITTKRGKVGQAQVGFNMYYGRQVIRRKLDVLDGPQFATLFNEIRTNAGLPPGFPSTAGLTTTNWQDEIYRPAGMQNYQLNVSGGTDKTRYYLAGGYFRQDGISLNSGFDRYTFRLNLDQQLGGRFRVGTALNLSKTGNNNSSRSESGAGNSGTVLGALAQIPTIPVRNPDGTYAINNFDRTFNNPVGNLLESSNLANIYQVIGNVFGELDILKNLTLRSSAGIDFRIQTENEFLTRDFPGTQFSPPGQQGQGRTATNEQLIWLQENTLTYRPELGERHRLTLLAGESMQASQRFTSSAGGSGYASNAVPYLSGVSQFTKPSSYADEWGLLSFFGRAIYDYDQRYLATLSLRADGSSRFRDGQKFGYFPALGLGWRVSKEAFFPQNTPVSELKLRGSVGVNGNQEVYTYQRFPRYGVGFGYPGVGGTVAPGITQTDIGNDDVKWETTTQYNAGLDLGLLADRLVLTVDVYRKNTRDLLTLVDIPLSTGSGSLQILQNVGRIRNQGLELGLTTTNLRGADKGLGWTTSLNVAFNRNRVLELGQVLNTQGQFEDRRLNSGNGFTLTGQPLGVFYGFVTDGIFQNQDEVRRGATQSAQTAPGDIRFRDLNGDGIINDRDRQVIGDPNPQAVGGVTNTITYRGLELSIFFQGSFGNQVYNQNRETLEAMSAPLNQDARVLNRWTPTNTNTDVPRAIFGDPNGNARYSDRFLEDGSYVRLKNLTLAYNLPADLIRRAALRNLRFYLTGQNLLTWTRYSGYDPEVSSDPFSTTGFGRDFGVYPQARTFTAGVNATF